MEPRRLPYLIQRFDLPFHDSVVGVPLTIEKWGGSTGEEATPGWSKKVKLNEWCPCDYMGASEFEFGALSKAYKRLYALKLYHVGITIDRTKSKPDFKGERLRYDLMINGASGRRKTALQEDRARLIKCEHAWTDTATVWLIASEANMKYAQQCVLLLATDERADRELKEPSRLRDVLMGLRELRTSGWLVVDEREECEPFAFFYDKDQFKRFSSMVGSNSYMG